MCLKKVAFILFLGNIWIMQKPNYTILLVDDERLFRKVLRKTLTREGYKVLEAADGIEALALLKRNRPDLLILDYRMPKMNGRELLLRINEEKIDVPVIMLSAYGNIQLAVDCLKLGAVDYLEKPVEAALLKKKIEDYLSNLQKTKITIEQSGIVTEDPKMLELLERLRKIAPSEVNVLITGESGTGKELIAHTIHRLSSRRHKNFVVVDCAVLTPSLFESELFGHVKGAFTGAVEDRVGKLEIADKGTVFLDEIGNIALELQSKLLRVVERKEFSRVGSSEVTKVDVRFISATNVDLWNAISSGRFKEDLYFRLDEVRLVVPPLRERGRDVEVLTDYFIERYARVFGKKRVSLTKEARDIILSYSWPGNVRELEHCIKSAVLICDDRIRPSDLPDHIKKTPKKVFDINDIFNDILDRSLRDGIDLVEEHKRLINRIDRRLIVELIQKRGLSQTKVASMLGISRNSLREKMKKLGLL